MLRDKIIEIFVPADYFCICFDEQIKHFRLEILGKAMISDQRFENPNGSSLNIDLDYFGNKRNDKAPNAGPFEKGDSFIVWPKKLF